MSIGREILVVAGIVMESERTMIQDLHLLASVTLNHKYETTLGRR